MARGNSTDNGLLMIMLGNILLTYILRESIVIIHKSIISYQRSPEPLKNYYVVYENASMPIMYVVVVVNVIIEWIRLA